MNLDTLYLVGLMAASMLVAAAGVLHQIAPHTETKVDDKIDSYGQKALPFLVRALDWFRAKRS